MMLMFSVADVVAPATATDVAVADAASTDADAGSDNDGALLMPIMFMILPIDDFDIIDVVCC
jgi:hypothetical protein